MTIAPESEDPNLKKAVKLGQVFQNLNRKFEEQETQRHARTWQLPYFDLTGFPIDQTTLATVSYEDAQTGRAIPFFREGPILKLGLVDPGNPVLQKVIADLKQKKFQVELYLISWSSFLKILPQYEKIIPAAPQERHEIIATADQTSLDKLKSLPDSEAAIDLNKISASEYLSLIIGGAVLMRASDIHVEPERNLIKIRFRVDGVLQDIVNLPKTVFHLLFSRLKLLAGMKLNITTKPQEGRFRAQVSGRELDVRIAMIPTASGESAVMRLLGAKDLDIELDIEKLGFRGQSRETVYKALQKPNGMILTCGPTGAGKTTTLYSFLKYLNKPGVKIITLEDPVEYELGGVTQTPIDRGSGMDFAKSLRSILRQDPDIVMVGEIRDFETAETASQAALTGHLVLSTLHTNDAAGAIPRLLDLGVKPVTLAPALHLLIAQRLLRKICSACRELHKPAAEELARVRQILEHLPLLEKKQITDPLTFYKSKGCAACKHLGYFGRTGVFELFVVTDSMQQLLYKQASTQDIKKQAISQGMVTMQQNAILTALDGTTDLAEVWRVTEE